MLQEEKQTRKISTRAKLCSRSEDYGEAKTSILFSPLLRAEGEDREVRWAQDHGVPCWGTWVLSWL